MLQQNTPGALAEAALRRLPLLGRDVKRRATAIWEAVKRAWEWWLEPRGPWAGLQRAWQWLKLRPRIAFTIAVFLVAIVIVPLLVGLGALWRWYSFEQIDYKGGTYHHPHADVLAPIATFAAAVGAAFAAITAWRRHVAQTEADRQRRLTESYSKAVEQLAKDKIEERLGGIYSLEQISKESASRYWTVMETLTAFVRERASWKETERRVSEQAYFLWKNAGGPDGRADEHWREAVETTEPTTPRTDIAAVLTVIRRRDAKNYYREEEMGWRFDLGGTDLRGADLIGAHLEGAYLREAHLEGATFSDAHLEGANLWGAHLEGANLQEAHFEGAELLVAHLEGAELLGAHLEGADLWGAHLEGANLWGAHLEGAELLGAHLKGAKLQKAHFEGANLMEATGLTPEMLAGAFGDADTKLPNSVARPAHWPPASAKPNAGGAG
jgi:Protein of unknown function (DUF2934)/Pentapeptide repeats (8 copies)